MKSQLTTTLMALGVTVALAACNPNTPQAERDAQQARAAVSQAGDDLSAAAQSTANAAGEGLQAAATTTAEAAGKASVTMGNAVDEAGQALDQATEPMQRAYNDGRTQQQMQEGQVPMVQPVPPTDPAQPALPPTEVNGPDVEQPPVN